MNVSGGAVVMSVLAPCGMSVRIWVEEQGEAGVVGELDVACAVVSAVREAVLLQCHEGGAERGVVSLPRLSGWAIA